MRTLLILLMALISAATGAEPLRVAVAANFRATLEQVNDIYSAEAGREIVLSSASTGVLASQIMLGAPFHLFLAADADAPALLHQRGLGQAPFCYARGELALAGGDLQALADPALSLSIANPETAPYGRAAEAVLQRPDFRTAADRKLVRGNNVLQAYQFWHGGAVDLALVARSLVAGAGTAIPADWYPALVQHGLVIRPHPGLDAYLELLGSDRVRSLILEAGYLTCP